MTTDQEAVMGHYHRIVNLTRHQILWPQDVGELDKLCEFGPGSGRAMAALWMLLSREAWCGDRIAILGYEGRANDLAPEVVADTGLDGTAFYAPLEEVGEHARDLLTERGICSFSTHLFEGHTMLDAHPARDVEPANIDVVAVNLDRGQVLDPARFGDDRDLHRACATGGDGGVTTALSFVLAASNRGGGRGGGDFRSRDPLVGSWAGDHIGVVPLAMVLQQGYTDISSVVRGALEQAGQGSYEVSGGTVRRPEPPWVTARRDESRDGAVGSHSATLPDVNSS